MQRKRPNLPKAAREGVLRAFNHRCAICGEDRPQLHHIDGNPANNASENLIPLCPNCHLIDQHNPTEPLPPQVLALFRQFRDPSILAPGFEPVFRRLKFVVEPESIESYKAFTLSMGDLEQFLRQMPMGNYYANRLSDVLREAIRIDADPHQATAEDRARLEMERRDSARRSVLHGRAEALRLIVEMLRYQPWAEQRPSRRTASGMARR